MTDNPYQRLKKTASRTQAQRRADNKLKKQLAQGVVPDTVPTTQPAVPRRPGLRTIKYNYAGHDPKRVDPNKAASNSAGLVAGAVTLPVPRLKNQDDIPASDSPEPEERSQALLPLAVSQLQAKTYTTLVHNDDDNKSQASTVLEDMESGTSESECDANEGLETEEGNVHNVGFEGNHHFIIVHPTCKH
ncbi:hypothetical protein BDV93DRAFT_511586 [Ceratobasidium sp. AG-I]|nr:hypothetical protein BDV93DRAFT_511586 [Ceratobasidium sp. AG-I]